MSWAAHQFEIYAVQAHLPKKMRGKVSVWPFDLSWTGPWWLDARSLPHVPPIIVLPVTLALLGLAYWAVNRLWDPMGRAIPLDEIDRGHEPRAGEQVVHGCAQHRRRQPDLPGNHLYRAHAVHAHVAARSPLRR